MAQPRFPGVLPGLLQTSNSGIVLISLVRKMDAANAKLRETWDRLVLLLIAEPRKGWEREFREITRREVERLELPNSESESDE